MYTRIFSTSAAHMPMPPPISYLVIKELAFVKLPRCKSRSPFSTIARRLQPENLLTHTSTMQGNYALDSSHTLRSIHSLSAPVCRSNPPKRVYIYHKTTQIPIPKIQGCLIHMPRPRGQHLELSLAIAQPQLSK